MTAASHPGAAALAETRRGAISLVACLVLWCLYPFYFKILGATSPFEVVAHRGVWGAVFLMMLVPLVEGWAPFRRAITNPRHLAVLFLTSALIIGNWLTYVVVVTDGRVLEASLGYFLGPLTSVALGVFMLKERLTPVQKLAVAIAVVAVLWLTWSIGRLPLLTLFLATTFSLYGALRKKLPVGPLTGLLVECLIALPFAMGYFLWMAGAGGLAFGNGGRTLDLLLLAAGPLTVAPLFFFNFGAKRLNYATVGILMYIVPSWLFVAGVWIFGEPLDPDRLITFVLIWIALAFYTGESVWRARRQPA
ncbi:EamA family transporter RarD [Geminicoccaceae bacterium 1502E]|nr:EamA family transporter RarD [Geminicoccaceae bacterium 1502E]